jgi:hypothetical protein
MFALILLFAYFVSFTDKPEKTAPQLSPRAVEQRAKWSIPTDQMDYPVSSAYLNQLRAAGAKIYHVSRWFNGATVEMDEKTAAKVAQLSFVTSVEMTREGGKPSSSISRKKRLRAQTTYESSLSTDAQLATYNLHPLHNAGFEGQGILMAICDGGFTNANTLSCFRQTELELGHFDFTDDADDFYGSTGKHGTACLSTISGIRSDFYPSASKAQYYLMRSEENDTESPKEMDNLVAALEKADSLGVNIFSVSLGYAFFDNDSWSIPKSALDGVSTRCSRAATIAARKGMLICVAAGNDGNDPDWRTIAVPADADSVLTVGAVDIDGVIGYFSSWGPSADGRVKPEVCAVGVQTTLLNAGGNIYNANGTSFATPLLAGMAACLWSALPDENAMQIRERILRSSDRYTNPDPVQYGYGIPDAWEAYQMTIPTGLENEKWEMENGKSRKLLRNGQLLILRGDQVYTITGQKL